MSKKLLAGGALVLAAAGGAVLMLPAYSIAPPPMVGCKWDANPTGHYADGPDDDWSNVVTVVIRSPDISIPKDLWEVMLITTNTIYTEPRTNSSMFYTAYNSNTVTGARSD